MKCFVLVLALVFACGKTMLAGPERIEANDSKVVQEVPVEKPPCRWTGFYVGVHGGYSWGDDLSFRELNETDPAYVFDQDGGIGGGQAGFNLQLGSRFVIGVEGTFSGGNFDDSASINAGGEISDGRVNSDWIATAAARLGFTFCKNRVLAYAKGGAAFTQFDYHTEERGGNGERFDADEDRTAALAGLGLEYAVTCHWTVKLEYNHLFFGSDDVTGIEGTGGGPGVERTFRADVGDRDTVEAGVNFKF